MQKIITEIISEASGLACWVYIEKYINHKTLDEMLEEWGGADKFIIVMDTLFEKLLKGYDMFRHHARQRCFRITVL